MRICTLSVMLAIASTCSAATRLERAVLELPAKAIADMPLKERRIFIEFLRKDGPQDPHARLDPKNRFLDFFTDGWTPFHASSRFYLKVFVRADGGSVVLCHMVKPQTDVPPAKGQTFVFESRRGKWVDVTSTMLPKEVSGLWYFQPQRDSLVVEAGPYKQYRRRDGRGTSYSPGEHLLDLIWNGRAFEVRKAASPKFHGWGN